MSAEFGVPSDNTTLTDVLDEFASAGHADQFEVTDAASIRCVGCGSESEPAEFSVAAFRRLEGASDPDDMISVVAVACPRCGRRGTLVLGFGPNAAAEESTVGKQLRQSIAGDVPPPASPPG